MRHNLKKYCSTVSLFGASQLIRLYEAAGETYLWIIPSLCFGILLVWDVESKEDRRGVFYGTDWGCLTIYAISITMVVSGIVINFNG